jgi:hypothetical protein
MRILVIFVLLFTICAAVATRHGGAQPVPPPVLTAAAARETLGADADVRDCWARRADPYDPCWATVTQVAANALGAPSVPTLTTTPAFVPPARVRSVTVNGRALRLIEAR